MTYPSEWMASTDLAVESGDAKFKIEGVEYRMRLESFDDFVKIGNMLDATFKQGKVFAAQAIRGHLERSIEDATREHGLL